MRNIFLCIVLIITAGYTFASCGGDGPCAGLCREVRPKLLEQMPDVSPEDIQCSEPPWTEQKTCADCLQLLEDLFDATATDKDTICMRHFGTKY